MEQIAFQAPGASLPLTHHCFTVGTMEQTEHDEEDEDGRQRSLTRRKEREREEREGNSEMAKT